ncbi:uncharacterized protein H6S33_011920 [Morchella sextelata]|uniref:uncharacterized protein n=1 Tax=Morchella sextelata TaxID=1174677 RepID=UPI001D03B774|nr:uncharacterized protein H6S33_011920 [Morchella sextelata]KAH0610393.1 hypothetical protein H6S33_011920 [Morchella sextelata]
MASASRGHHVYLNLRLMIQGREGSDPPIVQNNRSLHIKKKQGRGYFLSMLYLLISFYIKQLPSRHNELHRGIVEMSDNETYTATHYPPHAEAARYITS